MERQGTLNTAERIGLGGAPLGNLYAAMSEPQAMELLEQVSQSGIGVFDTAPLYGFGLSERRIGDFLRYHPGRHKVRVNTKVGRGLVPCQSPPELQRQGFVSALPADTYFDYSYFGIMASFEASANRLGVPIHTLYIHDLGRLTHGKRHLHYLHQLQNSGLRALEELKRNGDIQAIGLGVNEVDIAQTLLDWQCLDSLVIAGRYTLLEQTALSLINQCYAQGVEVIAAGVYNSGILASPDQTGLANYNYLPPPDSVINKVRQLNSLCQDHQVSLSSVALQLVLAHPGIACALIGMRSAGELQANLTHLSHDIPPLLWLTLQEQKLLDQATPVPQRGAHAA